MFFQAVNREKRSHLRWLVLFGFSSLCSFGSSIGTQSFNSLTWAGSTQTGYTEYSVTTVGPTGLNFVNVVDASGKWLVQNLPIYESGVMATAIGGFTGGPVQTYQTAAPFVSAPTYNTATPYSSGSATYMANNLNGVAGDGTFSDPGPAPAAGTVSFGSNAAVGFVYHLGVPDIPQGPNECIPTSAG